MSKITGGLAAVALTIGLIASGDSNIIKPLEIPSLKQDSEINPCSLLGVIQEIDENILDAVLDSDLEEGVEITLETKTCEKLSSSKLRSMVFIEVGEKKTLSVLVEADIKSYEVKIIE